MTGYFVYVSEGRHLWRFVFFAYAMSGEEAIERARAEGRTMGNDVDRDYMAVPHDAVTTKAFGRSSVTDPSQPPAA